LTRLDHLKAVERSTGKKPKELVSKPLDVGRHIWKWWLELNIARQSGIPISYQEIEAWARLTNREPTAFEVKAIYAIEQKYFEVLVNGN
jgi:hypothetical protein